MPVLRELGRGRGLGALASLDLRGRCAGRNRDLELDQELHASSFCSSRLVGFILRVVASARPTAAGLRAAGSGGGDVVDIERCVGRRGISLVLTPG
jgi:hypothetical protein